MNRIVLLVYCLLPVFSFAQTDSELKSLGHEQLVSWNRIDDERLSPDGRWVMYTLKSEEGDPRLLLGRAGSGSRTEYPRAAGGRFSADSRFAVFLKSPSVDTLKALRRAKTKEKDLPKDTLVIVELASGQATEIPRVISFQLPDKWPDWVAYHHYPALPDTTQQAGADSTETKEPKKENKENGSLLTLRKLSGQMTFELGFVTHYLHAEDEPGWVARSTGDDSLYQAGIFYFSGESDQWEAVYEDSLGHFGDMAISHRGNRLAFLTHSDTTDARIPPFTLRYWERGEAEVRMVVDTSAEWLYDHWMLSTHRSPFFSEDDSRLFFGIAPQPILPDTNLLPEEVVNVEVWTWQDERLYPQQNDQLENDKKRSWLAAYSPADARTRVIQDSTYRSVRLGDEGNSRYGILLDESPYYRSVSWAGFPARKDLVRVDLESGETQPLARGIKANPQLSPGGRYAYWYNYADSVWQTSRLARPQIMNLTDNDTVAFYNELHDTPSDPGAYGIAGWMENDSLIIIYDRYDLWKVNPYVPSLRFRLTRGRESQTRYRYIPLDPEERHIPMEGNILLHTFSEKDKTAGYAWLDLESGEITHHHFGPYYLTARPQKAKDADRFLFTYENFETFPDLRVSGPDFADPVRVSEANPQQSEYRWGSAELVEWTSLDGQTLQGMLIKPEGFDPARQYPMIVNFYEKSSDRLHRHRAPYPHRSTINYAFYASRGYLIFNPDVPYRTGYPGESAYNSVMSGVTHLIDQGFVDPDRIGLQGHSWGGYQVAYLLTKTDLFACAESGAPVVNMTSAYGGIRWGSGLSRMFQYEHTQSRIGGTLWEYPLRYLENSPLFFTDKINTPVLILHNDKDGAVPWYQGIEWFVALRRLDKPAWMLNYNNEPHWPLKLQNRVDFNIRMAQFFDHYLQDAARPQWMERGVPALEKGIRQGLELMDE